VVVVVEVVVAGVVVAFAAIVVEVIVGNCSSQLASPVMQVVQASSKINFHQHFTRSFFANILLPKLFFKL